jgi:hypothetical protein
VDRADIGDHADIGVGDRAELGDLAQSAHPHLEHQDVGRLRGRQDREGQADLGVVVLRARLDLSRKDRPADVLDRSLPRRPGDADDAGAEIVAPAARQRLQRRQRILGAEDPARPF